MIRFFYFSSIVLGISLLTSCGSSGGKGEAKSSYDSANGRLVYQKQCQVCHQINGMGVPKMFPPLVDNNRILDDHKGLINPIVNGLTGAIEVNGVEYNGIMASYGNLSDKDLADVSNYILFDLNKSNSTVISESDIANSRRK